MVQTSLVLSTKETQSEKILKLLKLKGEVSNYELNRIAFRYAARVAELRKAGHNIESRHIKGSLWKFKLVSG